MTNFNDFDGLTLVQMSETVKLSGTDAAQLSMAESEHAMEPTSKSFDLPFTYEQSIRGSTSCIQLPDELARLRTAYSDKSALVEDLRRQLSESTMREEGKRRTIRSLESDLHNHKTGQWQVESYRNEIKLLQQQLKGNEDRMQVCEVGLAEEKQRCEILRKAHARTLAKNSAHEADGVQLRRLYDETLQKNAEISTILEEQSASHQDTLTGIDSDNADRILSANSELKDLKGRLLVEEAALVRENQRYATLEASHNELLGKCEQKAQDALSARKHYETACLRSEKLSTELAAQSRAQAEIVSLLKSENTRARQSAESQISQLEAEMQTNAENLQRTQVELQDAQNQLEGCQKLLRELREREIQSEVNDTQIREDLSLSQSLNLKLEADLRSWKEKAHNLDQRLQDAEDNESVQEDLKYNAEVQLQNYKGMQEKLMELMYGELNKVREVILHSASDGDLLLGRDKLLSGTYLTLHTAHHTEYGVETWVRYFSEHCAQKAVEALGLCSIQHRGHYKLAISKSFNDVPQSVMDDPRALAEMWRMNGDLWRWSKSIDEYMRAFIDVQRAALAPRGTKRKSPLDWGRSHRRSKPDARPELEAPPTQLTIEGPCEE